MTAGFDAALAIDDDSIKLELAKIVLKAGLSGKSVDKTLVSESKRRDANIPFCSLLLHHKAQVDHENGEALNNATRMGALSLLEKMLAVKRASESSLSRSFNTSQSLDPRLRPVALELIFKPGFKTFRTQEQVDKALLKLAQSHPADLPSLKVLLHYDASVHFKAHQALKHAARASDNQALKFLLEYVEDNAAASVVFGWLEEKILSNEFWKSQSALDTLQLLLRNGARGETVNKALVLAITEHHSEPFAEPLLLQWDSDVNYDAGCPLQEAAKQGIRKCFPGSLQRLQVLDFA